LSSNFVPSEDGSELAPFHSLQHRTPRLTVKEMSCMGSSEHRSCAPDGFDPNRHRFFFIDDEVHHDEARDVVWSHLLDDQGDA